MAEISVRRWLFAVVALIALVGGACRGGGGGELVAGPDGERAASIQGAFLARAAERSGSTAHRLEFFLAVSGSGDGHAFSLDGATPLMTGVQDGDRFHFRMDLQTMFESMGFGGAGLPPELSSGDLSMEVAGDSSVFYIRSPLFAAIGEFAGGADTESMGPMDAFAELGDGWGKVDLAMLGGDLPPEIQQLLTGGQSYDPDQFLQLLADVADVEELGSATIRGVQTTGVRAEVSMADLLAAQGIDPDAVLKQLAADDASAAADADAIKGARFPIEAWTDADGYVRRIVVVMNEENFGQVMAASEAQEDLEGFAFSMTMTVEFFDYGDESITVEFPAESVELTAALMQAMQSSSFGG